MFMPQRLPLIPTILVALAVAVMVVLGVWQLERGRWKRDLLAQVDTNRDLSPVAYPAGPDDTGRLLFRRASGICRPPVTIRTVAGRNARGNSGWSHVATCADGGDGRPTVVDIGWSADFRQPEAWSGGPVSGTIVPDAAAGIRLVAAEPAPGLQPSRPPGLDTIPNNHGFYAAQWFFFAAAAALIYALALRRRWTKSARTPA